jgi:spore coat polysaccharide biosynthesis protein SpsF
MTKKPHIAAVVQARMRSTRLPGKVLKPIAGQPLLWHILHRLAKSQLIQTICVATTRDPADDELAAYAAAQGAMVVRGPEDDVLGRLALAMYAIDPDVIVRVNADAPLVDAAYVDYLIGEMMRQQADFVMPRAGVAAHDGAEVMSRWAIDKLVVKAHEDPIAKAHVTAYFKIHPDFVKVAQIDLPQQWQFNGARLSVDTPADVTFIETIYERLHAQAGEATLTDLVALLEREPALLGLNAPLVAGEAPRTGLVIMRCDDDPALGLTRVRRCIGIARALSAREGFTVRFAVNHADAAGLAEDAGFACDVMSDGVREIDWLLGLAEMHTPAAIVLDICSGLSATSVMRMRGADTIVATIEDMTPRRLSADAAFYAPLPQVFALNWEGAEAEPYVGWEWVALDTTTMPPLQRHDGLAHVVVSMGADEHMTAPVVRALSRLAKTFDATVVIGEGTPREIEAQVARLAPHMAVVRSAEALPKSMHGADLGVIGFGPAAIELAALGVPALYVCTTEEQALSASAFERAGMGYSLVGMSLNGEVKIAAAAGDLLADLAHRRAMSAAGRMNIDGRGALRIAARLTRLVEERSEALGVTSSVRPVAAAG